MSSISKISSTLRIKKLKKTETDYNYNHTIYKCKKCKIVYNNEMSLNKHSYIHINPIYCYYPNCSKKFSPKHTYQYKQHIDSHKGGINIKCKFCNKYSKSLSSNTLHMKANHIKEYNIYIKHLNEFNDDNNILDISQITKLTNLTIKHINIDNIKENEDEDEDEDDDDPELQYIEDNKYNNLDLFADIALAYEKHK